MNELLDMLPPRSYSDCTVPVRPDGTSLYNCRSDDDYAFYVAWLAEYLYKTELPLSKDQSDWLGNGKIEPWKVIFRCSDIFGYALWELEHLNGFFEENAPYLTYVKEIRALWEEYTSPEEKMDEDFAFSVISETTFSRLKREWVEEKLSERQADHADIPFRPLLAWALRQIPDANLRRKEIDDFFRNFSENAAK
jgi:hypothetical protein